MHLRLVAFIGLSGSLLGCSINPLPDDISRSSTYDIVHKIKCEARQGLIDFPYKFPPEHVIASYEGGAAPPPAAPPPGRPHFPDPEFLRLTAIGFYFQFDVTEKNNAQSGKLDFLNPFGGGSFQLTLTGKAEKKRQNVRTFVVVEYLDDLMKSQGCDGENLRTNPIYPITGSIGANETVETFLRLERKLKEDNKIRDKGLFSDELEFTTTFGAEAQPTLKLNAGAANFRLREVSLNANAERTDIHKVAMALATRENRPRDVARGAVLLESTGRLRSVGPTIISSPDPKDLVLQELYRLRSLDDDARVFNRDTIIVP